MLEGKEVYLGLYLAVWQGSPTSNCTGMYGRAVLPGTAGLYGREVIPRTVLAVGQEDSSWDLTRQ